MPRDPRSSINGRKSIGSVITTLVAGPSEKAFTVHEQLLTSNSSFFASAVKKEWNAGEEHHVPLPDDIPSVVELYIQWLYTGRVFSQQTPKAEGASAKEFDLLVEGFIFGEKIQDGNFKDVVIDALIHCVATRDSTGNFVYPSKKWVDRAYEGTGERSPLRKLMVHFYAFHVKSAWIKGSSNTEFLRDLASYFLDSQSMPAKSDPTRTSLSSCLYHQHGEPNMCYQYLVDLM